MSSELDGERRRPQTFVILVIIVLVITSPRWTPLDAMPLLITLLPLLALGMVFDGHRREGPQS